jgi:hypothetical protein
MTTAIVNPPPWRQFDVEAHIWALFLMWGRAPRKTEPDETGAYDLSEIGEVRLQDQRLKRDTPYSICRGIRE